MKLSNFFVPILKEEPHGAEIASHKLMLRAGMIKQVASGIYSWLPLGTLVLNKVSNIIRKNMHRHSIAEVVTPCIQHSDLWIESGRINDYGREMLKFEDRHQNLLIFGPTAEEVVTDIFKTYVKSYKDLPKAFYNIQWKFRDEIRPRFGVMRSREFLMKDAYSFDINQTCHEKSYQNIFKAYVNVFKDMQLEAIPVKADNGVIGGDLSHEFHILANTGESEIFFDEELKTNNVSLEKLQTLYAVSSEKHDKKAQIPQGVKILSSKSIEVGHIFSFATKYSIPMNALVRDSAGNLIPVYMGSYGIGVSRLVAALIESNYDEHGIVWPKSVSPFSLSLINIHTDDAKSCEFADLVYQDLVRCNIEALYDDTNNRAGVKFATHDLIGFPYQILISKSRTCENVVEIKNRKTGHKDVIKRENVMNYIDHVLK